MRDFPGIYIYPLLPGTEDSLNRVESSHVRGGTSHYFPSGMVHAPIHTAGADHERPRIQAAALDFAVTRPALSFALGSLCVMNRRAT
jgi:hypothetical protein